MKRDLFEEWIVRTDFSMLLTPTSSSGLLRFSTSLEWLAEFKLNRPDPEVLQKQVDEFMVEYDKREEERRRQREKLAAEVRHKRKTKERETGSIKEYSIHWFIFILS